MPNPETSLSFPSGLTIVRAKKRAKKMVRSGAFSQLTDAQNSIAQAEVQMPWSLAMDALKSGTVASTSGVMTKEDIHRVMQANPNLTDFGFGIFRDRSRLKSRAEREQKFKKERDALANNVDHCNKAMRFLQFLDQRKNMNRAASSYGLKHNAEFFLGHLPNVGNPYITNGAFICAALFMGFKVEPCSWESPNAHLNFSMKSPVLQWQKLSQQYGVSTPQHIKKLDGLEKLLGLPTSVLVEKYRNFPF